MNTKIKKLKLISFLIVGIASNALGNVGNVGNLPLNDPSYAPIYELIDRLSAQGKLERSLKNTHPLESGEVLELISKVSESDPKDISSLELKRIKQVVDLLSNRSDRDYALASKGENHAISLDLRIGEELRRRGGKFSVDGLSSSTILRPKFEAAVRDDFFLYSDVEFYYLRGRQVFDLYKDQVKEYFSNIDTGYAASNLSYVKFKLPWFQIQWGKDKMRWGPGRAGSLLVSDNPVPINMLKLSTRYKELKFVSFTGSLGSDIAPKYLSGHRLEVNLWNRGSLGIAETLVFGERFELSYLNPLSVYLISEKEQKYINGKFVASPDNVLVGGDLSFRILKNIELYGEAMIDDFQPDLGLSKLESLRNWDSKFGLLGGVYSVNPFDIEDSSLRVEYAFVNQYAYTHEVPVNSYTHFSSAIGHPIGSDADKLSILFERWISDKWNGVLGYGLERHGEGGISKPHPAEAPSDDRWEFLSGVREVAHSLGVRFSYAPVGGSFLAAGYTFSHVKNLSHRRGENGVRHELVVTAIYRLIPNFKFH